MTVPRPDPALVADWLATQFLTPPDAHRIAALRAEAGQAVLAQIGDDLGCPSAIGQMDRALTCGTVETVAVDLQRRHLALFDGAIRRHHHLPPYASLWDGTGRLCGPATGRMQRVLRQLDMRVAVGGNLPADHLGIALAALAEAIRRACDQTIRRLLSELAWVERFTSALIRTDETGFYAGLARVLTAFLEKVAFDQGLHNLGLAAAS